MRERKGWRCLGRLVDCTEVNGVKGERTRKRIKENGTHVERGRNRMSGGMVEHVVR